ncbi:MAG: acyltransferase [Lachnospiraceae bacterium]|nr:acyltransferase [Lachnospiraceae bacterium]
MRRYYLDNVRWMTIVLVAVYHVIYIYDSIVADIGVGPFYASQPWDGLQYVLYPWFMVLLFIVAGMCSRYYLEKHSAKEFLRSRTRKLLVPCTIGLLMFGWVQGYISMAISDAFLTIPDTVPGFAMYFIMVLSGTGVLWFIQMLWFLSVLLFFIRKFEKGKLYELSSRINVVGLVLLVIPVYLSGLILNTPIIAVYRFGIYGFTFFLGYFVFAHDEVIDRLSKYAVPLIVAAVVLGVIYVVRHFGDNYAVMPTVNCIPAVAYGWAACLAILASMKKWGDVTSKFMGFMSKRSFGIYVFHYLPLSATAYVLRKYTSVPALPSYLLVALAAFAGSFVLYEVISRIPVIRWCVLGIKKEKAPKSVTRRNGGENV